VISDLEPSRPVKSHRRRNIIILIAGVLVTVVLGAFFARPHDDAMTVQVTKAAYTRFQTKLPETGIVQRPQTQTMAALVSGNLGQIYVRAGQHVSSGQLLATISNPQLIDAATTAQQTYLAAQGRARTAASTNSTLPAQNRSSIVQAEANLETARFNLNQAIQDQRAGTQSGLGYGGTSAAQQRAAADTTVVQRATDLREAKRIADADQALYNQKAIARNTVDQDVAKLQQAQVAYDQAKRDRDETYAQIARQSPVLSDRVRADHDAVTQAEAALASARATASQDKSGDVTAANADAQKAYEDWRYASDQVARMRIVAPFAGIVQTVATQTGDTLRQLQPGDAVTAGGAIVTISADAGFVVRAKVDEQDISSVRSGQRAIVSGEDLGTKTLAGHVAAIGAVAQKSDDPSNTSRQVIATISLDQTVPYLRDGMTVDVDIVTVDRPHVLAVPTDAIRHDTGTNKAYVLLVKNGRTARRDVRVGTANDSQTTIAGGLVPGDTIVAERNTGIIAAMRVKPTTAPTAAASASPHP